MALFAVDHPFGKASAYWVPTVYRDDANPNYTLRSRPWLGLKTLDNLTYAGDNEWRGGQIYDPNTGHTYDANVTLTSPDRLTVRGYWKLPGWAETSSSSGFRLQMLWPL